MLSNGAGDCRPSSPMSIVMKAPLTSQSVHVDLPGAAIVSVIEGWGSSSVVQVHPPSEPCSCSVPVTCQQSARTPVLMCRSRPRCRCPRRTRGGRAGGRRACSCSRWGLVVEETPEVADDSFLGRDHRFRSSWSIEGDVGLPRHGKRGRAGGASRGERSEVGVRLGGVIGFCERSYDGYPNDDQLELARGRKQVGLRLTATTLAP